MIKKEKLGNDFLRDSAHTISYHVGFRMRFFIFGVVLCQNIWFDTWLCNKNVLCQNIWFDTWLCNKNVLCQNIWFDTWLCNKNVLCQNIWLDTWLCNKNVQPLICEAKIAFKTSRNIQMQT